MKKNGASSPGGGELTAVLQGEKIGRGSRWEKSPPPQMINGRPLRHEDG